MAGLFEQLRIGSMTLKNRTFMAPMSLGYESQDGCVNQAMQDYWEARAKGGVGCIILDALSVDPRVPYLGNTLCFRSEESVAAFARFTQAIHAYGCKVIPQITHPGPESISAFFGVPPVASSSYLNSMGQKTRELTLEEIPGIIQAYARTALQAKQAGFDGIELHCAHAYMLLGSFLSPMRNKRTDCYGGCLENRARLLYEVLDAIKEACGRDFPVILRISGSERDPHGNTVEDIRSLVPSLIAHGVDAFEVSGGTQYEQCNKIIPCNGEPAALNLAEAKAIREVSTVPVILVGKINAPHLATKLVEQDVDAVVLGRALISDPEFVNKTQEGRFDEIAPCAACGIGCIGEQTKRRKATCVINPAAGRERELAMTPCAQKKRVLVIGGGIGGMAAARYAAMRGCEAILLERSQCLGGQLNIACVPPHKQEVSKWVEFLKRELKRLDVTVQMGCEANPQTVEQYHPDVVIVATGAVPQLPPVEGLDPAGALTADRVLAGQVVIPGGNVLVVGGGMVGLELCEYLVQNQRDSLQVTLVEMTDKMGGDMVVNNYVPAMKRLAAMPVKLLTNCKLCAVGPDWAQLDCGGQTQKLENLTHIVYACGYRADNALYQQLKDTFPEVYCIGDASSPRNALEAVRGACETVTKL